MNLKDYANEKGGNAQILADALGVSPASVSRWINGVEQVPENACPDIALIARVPLSELRPDIDWEKKVAKLKASLRI